MRPQRKRLVLAMLVATRVGSAHAEAPSFAIQSRGLVSVNHFSVEAATASAPPVRPIAQGQSTEQLWRKAQELYKATSRDAETFEAALLIPEIRLKIETALHQKLSDQMLRRLVNQSRSEAVFWYKYMQGLEVRQ